MLGGQQPGALRVGQRKGCQRQGAGVTASRRHSLQVCNSSKLSRFVWAAKHLSCAQLWILRAKPELRVRVPQVSILRPGILAPISAEVSNNVLPPTCIS